MDGHLWTVIGGADKGGILVRSGPELDAPPETARLSTGAVVRGIEVVDNRLCYERISGEGPLIGWVTWRLKHKELLIKTSKAINAFENRVPIMSQTMAAEFKPKSCNTQSTRSENAVDMSTVSVIGLSGEEVASLSLPSSSTILILKEEIADVCGVPPRQQRLIPFGSVGRKSHLGNNDVVATLGNPVQLQLVKLTEKDDWFKLRIRGMWSMSGKQCSFAATATISLKKVKKMIHQACGMPPEVQELEVDGIGAWTDEQERLGDILVETPRDETPVTIYLFAKAHPERAKLQSEVEAGRMTVSQLAAIDPDALMPAC